MYICRNTNIMVLHRHLKLNGEVFYIGIGSKYRAYSNKRRNAFWYNITNKYEYEVQILKKDLNLKEACELEILLIDYYGRRDLGLGTLVNLTNGGEGSEGYKHTKESILKIKKFKQNISDHTKQLMSISAKNRGISKETVFKMVESRFKKVIDIETNIVYNSAKEVSEIFNIKYSTLTSNLNGNLKNNTKFEYYKES